MCMTAYICTFIYVHEYTHVYSSLLIYMYVLQKQLAVLVRAGLNVTKLTAPCVDP